MKLNNIDIATVSFMYNRLLKVHNENKNFDYMLKARLTVKKMKDIVKGYTSKEFNNNDVSGIGLITKERKEQIEKHKLTPEHDAQYEEGELVFTAISAMLNDIEFYPEEWNRDLFYKLTYKSQIERMKLAGALIAAEIDRLLYDDKKFNKLNKEASELADKIIAEENTEKINDKLIPAIPPDDYKGSVGKWMIELQERELWDGEGFHGDIMIKQCIWWEMLEKLES